MEEQYRKEITWWFAELGSESEVDNYLALFPELKSRLSKFAIGLLIWNIAGLIDKLKATVALGKDYDTFGGKSDKTEGTVKFIYRTESISADDE